MDVILSPLKGPWGLIALAPTAVHLLSPAARLDSFLAFTHGWRRGLQSFAHVRGLYDVPMQPSAISS